jgi:hypothetical protein
MRAGSNGIGRLPLRAVPGGVFGPGDVPLVGNRLETVQVNEIEGGPSPGVRHHPRPLA